jgi:hypothetical protein
MTQQDPQLMLLSPRSEITSLKKVIATKDACLTNFSKTLRAADEQTKRAEELLKQAISSKKDDGPELRDVEVFLLYVLAFPPVLFFCVSRSDTVLFSKAITLCCLTDGKSCAPKALSTQHYW